jgi:anti-sigma B factor antagonist
MTLEQSISTPPPSAAAEDGTTPLIIDVREEGAETHIVLTGELDLLTAPRLMRALLDLDDDGVRAAVVLDIRQLSFIDSTGLSVLIAQHKKSEAEGKSMVIYGPTPTAKRLFEITGLTDIFTIRAT